MLHYALSVRGPLGELLRAIRLHPLNFIFVLRVCNVARFLHPLRMVQELFLSLSVLGRLGLRDFLHLAAELLPLLLQTDLIFFPGPLQPLRDALVVLEGPLELFRPFSELFLLVGHPPLCDPSKPSMVLLSELVVLVPELLVAYGTRLRQQLIDALVSLRQLGGDLAPPLAQALEAGLDPLLHLRMLCSPLVRLRFAFLVQFFPLILQSPGQRLSVRRGGGGGRRHAVDLPLRFPPHLLPGALPHLVDDRLSLVELALRLLDFEGGWTENSVHIRVQQVLGASLDLPEQRALLALPHLLWAQCGSSCEGPRLVIRGLV
mmetsp:Transcript_37687/g.107115  ORF Transcript_37687/g.107115 Transcript_37687/m.107115 type:complete len:318 (-) Transcript_37687:302-1255(-)